MKHTCPNCQHVSDLKSIALEMQTEGGKARWKGVSKAKRSEAMSRAAKSRWERTRADKRAGE